jgi:hypothetical protein
MEQEGKQDGSVEFAFRWNYRKVSDGERMVAAIEGTEEKSFVYRKNVN